LEFQYQRVAAAGEPEHTERTVLFLVDAWALARPDDAAASAIAAAREAPEKETAAKQAVSEAETAAKRAAEVGFPTKSNADQSTAWRAPIRLRACVCCTFKYANSLRADILANLARHGSQALRAASAAADDVEPGTHGDAAATLPDPGSLTVAQLQVH